jgi:LPS export ABC transporter protein LptC
MTRLTVLCGALLAGLAACSLDYDEAIVKETMAESVPDVVLRGLEHTVVNEGSVTARIEASTATQYEKRNQTLLEDVHFSEFGDTGEVQTEIWADRATWHSDTEDAEATGDIYVHSYKEKAEVYAGSITWKKQDRLLTAGANEEVVLRRDDGSELRGTGFSADFRRSEIRMKAAQGVYVYKDEQKKDGEAPGAATPAEAAPAAP